LLEPLSEYCEDEGGELVLFSMVVAAGPRLDIEALGLL